MMIRAVSKTSENKKEAIPPILERYENKYTIPFSMIDSISDFIKPYCSPDEYSEKMPDSFYTVNSLYFDTHRYHFLTNKLSEVNQRFNMRIRSYGSNPSFPYFLEIKQKRGGIVRKYRAKVKEPIEQVLQPISDYDTPLKSPDKNTSNIRLFRRLVNTYNASPKVLVQYRRKAFISDIDEYARVTFDIELRYMPEQGYNPIPVERDMISCDSETCFDPGCNVILELKCYTSYVPLWMIDLIRVFNLKQRGFSKYTNCVTPVIKRYGYASSISAPTVPIFNDRFHEELDTEFGE